MIGLIGDYQKTKLRIRQTDEAGSKTSDTENGGLYADKKDEGTKPRMNNYNNEVYVG